MDNLGERIINDRAAIKQRRDRANEMEIEARRLRRETDEIERLLDLARGPL